MTLAFVVKCDWALRLSFYFSDFLGLLLLFILCAIANRYSDLQ